MTFPLALLSAPLVAGIKAKTTSSSDGVTFILFLVVIGLVGYFLLLRPQQQRARKQRMAQSDIAVGDEVLTIGGIVGTVLELHPDRVTILSGMEPDGGGEGGGADPTRIVLLRSAIARKIEPVVPPGSVGLEEAAYEHPGYGNPEPDGPPGPGGGEPTGNGGGGGTGGGAGKGGTS